MMQIIFRCVQNQNHHEEEVEFEDNATENDIQESFEDWVWEKVGDDYYWERKEERPDV